MHNRVVSNEILKNKKNEIVVPSEWMRNRIQEYVGSDTKVSIIPNPVHKIFHSQAKTTETDIKSREIKIGFVAADPWVPLKGLIGLLASLSEVKSITEEKLSLEIVGKIRKSSSLPKFATAVGIKKNAELVKFLDTIDFLVVPSLSENLPNIITEAQLRGTVVVATRVGGIPEMITDEYDGFLQQPDESLTSLLLRVIEKNPSFLASVSFQARTVSSIRNSREKIFKDYQTVYLKAISNE
jgi:glycosyltransferase involved in cell wall biosynthesis